MSGKQAELTRALESVVGEDHITIAPSLNIGGLKPALLVTPGSTEEVVACLGLCASADAAIIPAGLMSWLECGNPLTRAEVVLSLARMSRIIEYSPADLTATVEAGLTISELNASVRLEGQWLPLDPPGSDKSSLGAIASCASSGPLRYGFGTPRDYVIGLRLAHVDGTESKSGGRVVKNVAGYDMNKLYVGSFGTLAVLTELTFKLRPLPERSATMLVIANLQSLYQTAYRVLSSDELLPSSIFIVKRLPPLVPESYGDDAALLIRFIESEAAVNHQLDRVSGMLDKERSTLLSRVEEEELWKNIADLDRRADNTVRVSVPVSMTASTFDKLLTDWPDCVATADFGAGIIRMGFDADTDSANKIVKLFRDQAVSAGGNLFIERAASDVKLQLDAWGEVGQTSAIMKLIKAEFDPRALLNPGRFVAGI